jgi:cyanophycinase
MASSVTNKPGKLFILGGNTPFNEKGESIQPQIWTEFFNAAGGRTANIGIFTTGSRSADNGGPEQAEATKKFFDSFGNTLFKTKNKSYATIIPVYVGNGTLPTANNFATANADPANVRLADRCTGFYIAGGDQSAYIKGLTTNGRDSAVLASVRSCLMNRSGVVAGTSAGAALMSSTMFRGGTSVSALAYFGTRDQLVTGDNPPASNRYGVWVGAGAGFLPKGTIVESHFAERGRLARLIVGAVLGKEKYAIGIEEGTGLVYDFATSEYTSIGDSGATIIDLSNAKFSTRYAEGSGIVLHYVDHGDKFSASTGKVIPASNNQMVITDSNAPTLVRPRILDLTSPDAVYKLLIQFVKAGECELAESMVLNYDGLSLDDNEVIDVWKFSFRKTKDTQAWMTANAADIRPSYCISGISLSIEEGDITYNRK